MNYYCAFCYTHVDKDAKKCTNAICSRDLTESGAVSYFVRHSIIAQLGILFGREKFTESIRNHRFAHLRNSKNNICDVYDGKLYQTLFKDGFLSNCNNISFALNTDGVAIFKSSRVSMWPVYLLINELRG